MIGDCAGITKPPTPPGAALGGSGVWVHGRFGATAGQRAPRRARCAARLQRFSARSGGG